MNINGLVIAEVYNEPGKSVYLTIRVYITVNLYNKVMYILPEIFR